ncbi:Uncharacterised protein (plasmid) [Tsukamurella tyrosinosolvens]|uniref:Uncharacterized protein n=1 Tax=Tsukamurella tyrosinosolvens TaxID=57704 RepID=A0A1H4VMW8_TSUTY|nr:hypothetical protein [Tsukamurella tyrosinosolvens]KXO90943.1 hypothetical protein AXK58_21150 [Tsukamurella tyrosinosolvens]SEC81918.1 hypothetical protein SAMN04489793_3268 [Tsukamurella tyrosinosolvens]VEH90438.1 Uncharacterised protein [Tsukamurella tyrosinosolvens]
MNGVAEHLKRLIEPILKSGGQLDAASGIAHDLAAAILSADDLVVVSRPRGGDPDTAVIAAALREHNAPLIGEPDGYPGDEFDCCAEQVAAALRIASAQGAAELNRG